MLTIDDGGRFWMDVFTSEQVGERNHGQGVQFAHKVREQRAGLHSSAQEPRYRTLRDRRTSAVHYEGAADRDDDDDDDNVWVLAVMA